MVCGFMHTLALTDRGNIWSFGNGGSGRLGTGKTEHVYVFPRLLLSLFISLALSLSLSPSLSLSLALSLSLSLFLSSSL